jgi:NitT/TauT family transport system permease protein
MMTRSTQLQLATLAIAIGLLELLCRTGVITAFTMIPPSLMITGLYRGLASGAFLPAIRSTLTAAAIAAVAAIVSGCIFGALLHAFPRARRTIEPLLASYYAVPIWSFYPLFVYLFGLTDTPKIVIAYLYAVVAMIINTINGLDRVPQVYRKTALALGMGPAATLFRIVVPAALGYMFTGVKLAVSYAIIGVVGSEFILSTGGLGYQISWAYTSFDNFSLYPMILLIVVISVSVNVTLSAWERTQMRRRIRA